MSCPFKIIMDKNLSAQQVTQVSQLPMSGGGILILVPSSGNSLLSTGITAGISNKKSERRGYLMCMTSAVLGWIK